ALKPNEVVSAASPSISFSMFHPITVKLLLTDPTNHYIFTPACHVFTQVTRFTEVCSWVTPNMISVLRLVVVLPAMRLLLSESAALRQAGILVVLLGEWMDALDGFVARLRSSSQAVTSEVGTLGYYMDGVCDGISCAMLMLTCLAYLRRHPPRQSDLSLQLPVICSKVEPRPSESKEALLGGGGGGGGSSTGPRLPVPPRLLLINILLFSGQLLLTSVGWNHAVTGYQRELQNADGSHTARQLTVLKASTTWILMWFWRVACFHSMLHCFIIAVLFNKMWEFIIAVRYIGYVALLALIILNEVHLQTIVLYF
ncbi:ceramide phosphoethanolamine synthase-like, partial [Pollicipes pollicipes]|uniref:ceramide phosphoethanolamine synthase-like n=1 Tax=Pollicipes pollicipes TaxID=41117 RepID=UPI001884DC75